MLEQLLTSSQYNPSETSFLVNGFRNGFDLQYQGPTQRKDQANNLPFRMGSDRDMWEKIMKEVECGRYVGPFKHPPFQYYVQSPIGLVPKAGNKTRLIFHLSYNFKQYKSVNYYIPKEACTVKYNDLDHAVGNCLKLLKIEPDAVIWGGKTDLSSAFRVLPLKKGCWYLLIMKAKDPDTGKMWYFVDKCLPFGSSISCALFQCFSDALTHILNYDTHKVRLTVFLPVTNYLDVFLFLPLMLLGCNQLITHFIVLCEKIGVPIAEDKTVWACLHLVSKKKATVQDLQSLAGLLNFLNKVIYPGHAFTRCMYSKFAPLVSNDCRGEVKLLPHYHVSLDKEFREDCKMWLSFLEQGKHVVCHPFVDLSSQIIASELFFYRDSAAGEELGFGGVFNKSWFFGKWEKHFITTYKPSIAFLELFALCMGVFIWQDWLRGIRCVLFTDNQSVIDIINQISSKCRQCMKLVRLLTLKGLLLNSRFFARHVVSEKNFLADSLSCQNIKQFKHLSAHLDMDPYPAELSAELWPLSELWQDN